MSISTRLKGLLDDNQIPYSPMTHATGYTAEGAAHFNSPRRRARILRI
jgi:hypothetical protein